MMHAGLSKSLKLYERNIEAERFLCRDFKQCSLAQCIKSIWRYMIKLVRNSKVFLSILIL